MHFSKQAVTSLLLALLADGVSGQVNAGFDVNKAANIMTDKSGQSWEWGTAAQALLELDNNELSVFGPNPFPNGKIPKADPKIRALAYAKPHINRNSQVLVDKSAAGDPASLGVSAILLGQTDKVYLGAADRQADYLLNKVPKWSNGAISHRPDVAELWADNMAMSMPFCKFLPYTTSIMLLSLANLKSCSGLSSCSTQRPRLDGQDRPPVRPSARRPQDQPVPQLAPHHRPSVARHGSLVFRKRLGQLRHGPRAAYPAEVVWIV